jgi:hypothetical protein
VNRGGEPAKIALGLLKLTSAIFGLNGISNYLSRSFAALSFLDRLRISVEGVTGAGRPENATKPKQEDR